MNDTIRDRLELLLAKIAGNEVSIRTMTPGVVTNLTEKFLIDIANRIDDIEQASGVKPSLSKLTDVDLSSPSDGQALIYDAENNKWINETIDSTYSLKDMSDVNISSLSDEQALVYNLTTNKWENSNKIKNIDSQIGSINSSLVWLNNHMSESDGRITSLEGRATDLETQEAALSNRLTQAESDISDIDSIAKSTISNEASKFDTSEGTQYSVGDYCIYENKLYICKRNTSSPVFDITAWEEVNIGDELKKNRNDISSVASDAQSALDTASAASTAAASASTDASTALSVAASALSSATSAVSTANSAATDAATALATAAIASSDASTAVNTANTANTRSQNALKAIAPTYNTSSTYNAGDYCTNNGALYKCNADNTTGQWDATRWTKVNVGDELKLTSNVQSNWNETDTASDAYIQNKPSIPSNTSDLTNDSNFVSDASYVHTDNNFTNTIKDKIDSIASGAEVNVQSNWNETDSASDSYIRNKPSIPTVNDATLTVQKNGTDVGTFTANASSDSTINITVPTTAADVSALPSSTKYGSSITVSIDQTDYKITTTLKDQDGNTLGTAQVIDLPIESVVVSGSFDSVNKKIVLTLQNGSTIDIPVGDLVSGLQSEITSDNKLLSDLVDDTNQTNKFMTSAEKTKLSGIASGAEVNVQSDWNESVTTSDAYIKNKPSIPSNTSDLTNDSNFVSDASYVHTDNNFTSALKNKLDGIATGAEVNVQSDWNESVTTSDAYIKNKPSIPTKTSDLTNDSDYVSDASYVHTDNNFTTAIKNKVDGIESGAEANVQADWNEVDSTSDAYIQNKPTIPTVNNGKLTIQMNGSTVREFTANQSSNVTANITVPTKTSDITNDSDFVSDASYVHTDNNFTTTLKNKLDGIASGAEVNVQADWNQSSSSSDAFIKNKPTIPSKTSDLTNDSDFVEDASYVHTDNNFTSVLKNKLDGIAEGAEVNVQSDWNVTDNSSSAYIKNKPSIPTKTSDLTNDSGFVEDASYVHTDNNFTTSLKNKLNGIETGAEVNVQSDWSQTTTTADDYIKNKPTIPTKTSDLTNDSNFVEDASYVHTDNNFTSTLKNKLDGIASGAEVNVQADWNQTTTTADDYIKNKPTIPTVNNATLTIQKNGVDVQTFTANASSNKTANITVPTKTSDITNDSDFVSDASYVHTDNNFTTTLKNKLDGIAAGAEVNVQADWNVTSSTSDAFIKNKPTIPDELADLSDDSAHRLVTDTEKAKWNATSVYKELIDEDLDNVLEVGFYVGKAGNTCANKPANVVQFGLQVVRLATDAVYYKQILTRPTSQPGDEYVRTCYNGTWQDWKKRADFSGSYDDLTNKPADAGNELNPVYFSNGAPVAAGGNVVPYIEGTGTTAGTWTGTLTGLTAYYDGLLILYKTPVAGASTTTLNINGLGAKTIYTSGTTKLTTHFPINQPMLLVYSTDTDNGCWKAVDFYNSDTRPQAQCNTAAATAAKTADMTYYSLNDASYLMVNIRYTNTSASALTLNVNSTGAKDVYINGTISSASNYTLPAGSYLVYYKDSKYYFRTDGKITGDITGNAATVGGYTVGKNVPSNAVFTDRYVNSASFVDDTSANASNPVKMTLTRSGSDSQTVVANIPKVSSSTAGVVPKGATVSSQKQTTKFLREDGTWSAPSYTNNASQLTANGYLAYSPESARTIVPFINNDLAHLLLKGGSATLTCDNVLQTDGLTRIFDGSPSYFSKDNTGFSTAVFEITCNRSFNYSSVIYIDFGAPSFRAQSVKFEVINTDYANDTWETVYNNTANGESYCFVRTQHAPVGGAVSNGYNKIRITLSSFYTVSVSGFRVTQIGAIAYNSSGSMEVFLGKGGGYIWGDVYPSTNNTLSVGRSTNYFANGYFTKINGVSPVLTDDKVKITEDTSTSDNFRVLLDTSHNNNTVTESVSKNRNLVYNPSTGVFYTPREVINTTDSNVPLIVRTDSRSAVPANGDDIAIFNGAFKKTVSGTTSTLYNSVISLIGNNASTNVGVVRFGSSNGATIITGGAGAKAFPKNFVNADSSTGKYDSDGAIWLAAQSEVHIYTNASNSAAKFGGHIWMNQGGLRVDRTDASAGTLNNAYLIIGNNTAKSNAGAAKGTIQIWDRNSSGAAYSAKISPDTLTQERTITIPDESGIIQLQSQWELHGIVECDGVNMEYETTLPDGVTGICMYTTDFVAASSFTDPLSIYGTFSDDTGISILRDVTSCFVVTDISHDGLWVNQISTKNSWRPGITSLEAASAVIRTPVINKNSLKKIKISTIFHLNPPPEGLNVAILIRRLA